MTLRTIHIFMFCRWWGLKMIIAEKEDRSIGNVWVHVFLTRNYKSSVRSAVVRGRNFSWNQLANNVLNLFCFKSERETSLSENINKQNWETRNDFISSENWDNWPGEVNWIFSLTAPYGSGGNMMIYLLKEDFSHSFHHIYRLDSWIKSS